MTLAHNSHTINKPRPNAKTARSTRNTVNISTAAPSHIGVKATKKGFREEIAPSPMRTCDTSQKLKVRSPNWVITCPRQWKVADIQGNKAKLQATFGLKSVKLKVNSRKKTVLGENFSGSHQIYLKHSPETTSTAHPDKSRIRKNINFVNPHNIFKIKLVMTVPKMSDYYIRTSLDVHSHVIQSSICPLDTGAQTNLIARRYISKHLLSFI